MTHGGPQSLFPINLRCEGDDTETRGVCLSFITGVGGAQNSNITRLCSINVVL